MKNEKCTMENAESNERDDHERVAAAALARGINVHLYILHFAFCITNVHIVPGLQLNPNPTIRSSNAFVGDAAAFG